MAAPVHLRTTPPPDSPIMPNRTLRFYGDIALRDASREFRVLRLLPGRRGDRIRASVERLDLDNLTRPYATLSYTWGDEEITRAITIGDEEFLATINLYDALQHVRSVDTTLTLWVDAICINQWDLVEKSFQVSFMAALYRNCEKVYIWLGRPSDGQLVASNPFRLFEHFRDDKHFQDLPGYYRDEANGMWACDTQNPDYRALWDGMALITASSWWSRAWTVQETILPPDAVVMYGDYSISWADIAVSRVRRNLHIYEYSDDCCGYSHQRIPSADMQPFDATLGDVEELETIRIQQGYFNTFQSIERAFSSRTSKDPRDKIWSLLSFAPNDTTSYPVDYTTPVADVFARSFRTMLAESEGSLVCLFGYGFNSSSLRLPSWCRNFYEGPESRVKNYLQNRRVNVIYPLYNACRGRIGRAVMIDQGNRLQLRGVQIDVIASIGTACDDFWTDDLKTLLREWSQLCSDRGIAVSNDSRDDLLSLVLSTEVVDDPEDSPAGLWRLIRDPNDPDLPSDTEWSSFMNDGNGWALPRKFRGAVNTAMAGHALFTTVNRRLGLGYPDCQVGDEIWIIDGSRIPFVLRRNANDVSTHRLIGEAYLHGVMHGEGIAIDAESNDVILV